MSKKILHEIRKEGNRYIYLTYINNYVVNYSVSIDLRTLLSNPYFTGIKIDNDEFQLVLLRSKLLISDIRHNQDIFTYEILTSDYPEMFI